MSAENTGNPSGGQGFRAPNSDGELTIGVGDGGTGGQSPPPKKKSGKKFSGKNQVKFGHFVIFQAYIM